MTTYFVLAKVADSGDNADCSYYTDYACTQLYEGTLVVGLTEGQCIITQGQNSTLQLIGAAFKTLDNPTGMTIGNFTAAIGQTVFIPMPTDNTVVTKGAILLFAQPGVVTTLYASTDPQIKNNDV